jgi:maleylpyruvate isomerase
MVKVCTWAETGIETPMYGSVAERDAGIELGAYRSAAEIVADVAKSAKRLVDAFESLGQRALTSVVRLGAAARGPAFLASDIPWMRLREVEIHLVDLDLSPTFADCPFEFLNSLLLEEIPKFDERIQGLVLICNEGPRYQIGDGARVIEGSIGDITAWLLGRTNESEVRRLVSLQPIPTPPKWL